MFKKKVIYTALLMLSLSVMVYSSFWCVFWELIWWEKPLLESVVSSWWNWLLFVVSIFLVAFFNVASEHPESVHFSMPKIMKTTKKKPKKPKKKGREVW